VPGQPKKVSISCPLVRGIAAGNKRGKGESSR
jgi:hypothetical protein